LRSLCSHPGGVADGHQYIASAIQKGAAAVVGQRARCDLAPMPSEFPYVQVSDSRLALAALSAGYWGHPARQMTMIGVTGTDGKTTTANLIYAILSQAGRVAGIISTVNARIGTAEYDTGLHTTTPDAPDIQRHLAQMVAAGTHVAVLESTSHGLAQHRVGACDFDVAVVTNITHEHLDYHGTTDAYREAKARLFWYLSQAARKPASPKWPF